VVTTIVLVRHGETDWNRERRFQGRADTPLNDAGRAQARDLVERLRRERVSAVYTSPLRRAAETAHIVAERLGLPVRVSEPMCEIDVGSWEGLTIEEVRVHFPHDEQIAWSSGWDGGESYEELDRRVVAALLELAAMHPDEHVAVVTHGGPIRAAIAASHGLSFESARPLLPSLANGEIVRLTIRDGAVQRVD
jgi:probable phosphoglycerate mutase